MGRLTNQMKAMNDFDSFCTRMWLDNEDENLSPHAAGNRLTRDEYVDRWYDWLLDKWQNRDYKEDTLTVQEEMDLFRSDPDS